MRFYVKKSKNAVIDGPFTIEQINRLVREKRFNSTSLALADTGQGLEVVQNAPRKQWMKLADVRGYEPDPNEKRIYVVMVVVLVALMILIPATVLIVLAVMFSRIH